jgi:Domain of unknown function (DUF6602)
MKSSGSTDHFGQWVDGVSRLLAGYRDVTSATANHGEVLGKAREFFVSQVLRRFLPQALHVGSGQIVDADGLLSRQIDTLIYRHDMPLLSSLAETNLYFVEGVVSSIEVKSRLDGSNLRKSLENILSVKRLNMEYLAATSGGVSPDEFSDFRYRAPATYIFGYLGYKDGSLSDLRKTLCQWIREKKIEYIAHLPEVIATEQCVVVKNDYRFFDSNSIRRRYDCDPIFMAASDRTPLRWLLHHLLGQVGNNVNGALPNRSISELLRRSYVSRQALEDRAEFWGKWDRDQDRGRIASLD